MPKKKESVWTIGIKGPIGPWPWNVWVKGSKNPQRVVAFDLDHIQHQLEDKIVLRAKKIHESKEDIGNQPKLGPKGYKGSSRPADYDAGFKVLRQWIDENGGPPEEIRQKLRELWIDYEKPKKEKK